MAARATLTQLRTIHRRHPESARTVAVMRRTVIPLATLALTTAATGCGSTTPEAATSPAPSISPDAWANKTCIYLAGQDPTNQFSHDIAATMAMQSTIPEFVDLARKTKGTGTSNLMRAWCQKYAPWSGATPAQPKD